jgi:hypothetical protein
MQAALLVLLIVEVLASAFYCLRSWVWLGWQQTGPEAFPGSPDAYYLYESAMLGASWSGGLLIGLWVGSAGAVVASQVSTPKPHPRGVRTISGAVVALPALAFVSAKVLATLQGPQ